MTESDNILDYASEADLELDCSETGARMRLGGVIDVRCAERFRALALQASATGRSVSVDCGRLEYADLSALQILLALRGEVVAGGMAFTLESPSAELVNVIERSGLSSFLGPAREAD